MLSQCTWIIQVTLTVLFLCIYGGRTIWDPERLRCVVSCRSCVLWGEWSGPIASSQGRAAPPPSHSEWSFVGLTPAELWLLLLKWLTCTSNLAGLPTRPPPRTWVILQRAYNLWLCLGRANSAWLQRCLNCIDCYRQGGKIWRFWKVNGVIHTL